MKTHVKKWGNSLALRIPKTIAEETGLRAEATVELSVAKGKLIVRPIVTPPLTLEELLQSVTDENLPTEWKTGRAVGKEAW
jgi:antitoxin MazE